MLKNLILTLFFAALSACSSIDINNAQWKQRLLANANPIAEANTKVSNDLVRLRPSNTYSEYPSDACVVLIHGLWRSSFAMRSIESFLEEKNFEVINISYPSTKKSIPSLAKEYVSPAVAKCKDKGLTTHLVTHSMGGIVAHAYLQKNRLDRHSKVVMLSPPSKGSEISLYFKDSAIANFFAGEAAMSLHQLNNGSLAELKAFPEKLGVIAAYRSWSLWPESWLPKPNDGMVSVESMATAGMDDIVLINSGHAMMRYNNEVKEQILNFIRHGKFKETLSI